MGSYPADDVTFLLKDLGDLEIERGTEEREELIQTGTHYAEMLPVEYQPAPAYVELFEQALARSARRLAVAVGRGDRADPGGETGRGPRLARPGRHAHRGPAPPLGAALAATTCRTTRSRSSAAAASTRWRCAGCCARYPAASLQFVDGWTGKGAISRELTAAVRPLGLDDRLAVLADPGVCAPVFGTRDDFLIPSACLNSTVSGLVSAARCCGTT